VRWSKLPLASSQGVCWQMRTSKIQASLLFFRPSFVQVPLKIAILPVTMKMLHFGDASTKVGFTRISSMKLVDLMYSGTVPRRPSIAGTWNGSCGTLSLQFRSRRPISWRFQWTSFACFLHAISPSNAELVPVVFSVRLNRSTRMNFIVVATATRRAP
jgi:hypothetical protein